MIKKIDNGGFMDVRQISNRRKYDLAASTYDVIAYLMSLGQANRLYGEVADCLNMPPGGTIVELGCGPASVMPSLLKKIPAKVKIIGIDFSQCRPVWSMHSFIGRTKKVEDLEGCSFSS